jgi:outer membrane protein OmpA-like peptidoglycan-associated protein
MMEGWTEDPRQENAMLRAKWNHGRWMGCAALCLGACLALGGATALAEEPAGEPAGEGGASSDDLDAAMEANQGGKQDAPAVEAQAEFDAEAQPLRFYSAAPGAEVGLVRVMEAYGGPAMSMRLSLHAGFFTSDSFLNYMQADDYSESRVIGRIGLGFTPIRYLEAFINLNSSSNKNSSSHPGLLQTQGDLELGVKGIYPVLPYLGLGLDLAVSFFNGIGDVTPDFGGTSVRTALLMSFDVRPLAPEVPLRMHLNAGMVFENSDALQDGRELNWIEQYALRVNSYHRVALGFGVDAPLPYADPVAITPFLEYTVEIPVGVDEEALASSSRGDATELAHIVPMRLTPGVRFTYLKDLTLDVAVDVGLGGAKAYIDGVPSVPPYTVWLGLAYAFDPTQRGVSAPEPARLAGKVTSAKDMGSLGGVHIAFPGRPVQPVSSELEKGTYSVDLPFEGVVQVTASREGYKSDSREIKVERGETAMLDFSLEPAPKPEVVAPPPTGRVVGRVLSALDQTPVFGAILSFEGGAITPVATDDLEGKYSTYDLTPGRVRLTASRAGYKSLTQEAEVRVGETALLDFALEPDAKKGTLEGAVLNEKDQPLAAKLELSGPVTLELTADAGSGRFTTELPAGSYTVKASAEGYMAKQRTLEVKEAGTLSAEFKLSPKPKQVVVVLQADQKRIEVRKKIHFESGKTILLADSYSILDGVIEVLVQHPEIKKLRVEGHTDSVGGQAMNMRLSQGRAEAVMKYLVEQGVPSSKLEAQGFGPDRPIAPNSTIRGREQNRRVEFVIAE